MDARAVATRIARVSGGAVRRDGRGFFVRCPAHADKEPSLHVSPGRSGGVVLHCLAGCAPESVLSAAGLTWADLGDDGFATTPVPVSNVYTYKDESGVDLFVITRAGHGRDKTFRSCHLDAAGRTSPGVRGVRRVLYHLPEVCEAVVAGRTVYLCEGEKDADAMLGAYGVCATTNPFGATVWARDNAQFGFSDVLRGAEVVVVQDRDVTGMKRTQQIVTSLAGAAASIRVVQSAVGNDAADHAAAGLTIDQFVAVIPAAPGADDGSFAALPRTFFETAEACGLSHLQYRVLVEVARHSVRRENHKVAWQAMPSPSSWLARCCGGASPQQVRRTIALLREANILIDDRPDTVRGYAVPLLRI